MPLSIAKRYVSYAPVAGRGSIGSMTRGQLLEGVRAWFVEFVDDHGGQSTTTATANQDIAFRY
jgi:hypothetical protein